LGLLHGGQELVVLMGEGRQAGFILCGLGSPVRCLVVAFLFSQMLLLFPEGSRVVGWRWEPWRWG